MAVQGFSEDFLQTIVAVQWGGVPFAALQFQQVWVGSPRNPNKLTYNITQLGPPYATTLIQSPTPFHKETSAIVQGITTTVTEYLATQVNSGGVTTNYHIVTVTNDFDPPTDWLWTWIQLSSGATNSGLGTLDDAEADAGGDFISTTIVTQGSTKSPNVTIFTDTDNAVALFNLKAFKAAIGKTATTLDITMRTGVGPATVPRATVSYNWTAIFQTFTKGSFTSFPVDGECLPVKWPTAKTTQTVVSTPGTPVPSQNLDFSVDLTTI